METNTISWMSKEETERLVQELRDLAARAHKARVDAEKKAAANAAAAMRAVGETENRHIPAIAIGSL
jgi:hypothetical protein